MLIVIPRERDAPIQTIAISQEQRDKAWEVIIRTWAQKHPEQIKGLFEAEKAT